jgi:hypothetical protein
MAGTGPFAILGKEESRRMADAPEHEDFQSTDEAQTYVLTNCTLNPIRYSLADLISAP